MIKTWNVACAMVLGMSTSLYADEKPRADREQAYSDAMFVEKAGICGLEEVALGKIAQTNAERADVKQFAARMVEDHAKCNEKLMAAAKTAGIETPVAVPQECKKEIERLQALRGAEFDRAYLSKQLKGHEKAVALFTTASEKAQNAELKSFAAQTLPTLKEHYEMVKKLATAAGAGGE